MQHIPLRLQHYYPKTRTSQTLRSLPTHPTTLGTLSTQTTPPQAFHSLSTHPTTSSTPSPQTTAPQILHLLSTHVRVTSLEMAAGFHKYTQISRVRGGVRAAPPRTPRGGTARPHLLTGGLRSATGTERTHRCALDGGRRPTEVRSESWNCRIRFPVPACRPNLPCLNAGEQNTLFIASIAFRGSRWRYRDVVE